MTRHTHCFKIKYNLLVVASLVLITVLSSCQEKKAETSEAPVTENSTEVKLTDEQRANAQIETGKLQKQNISSILKVNGRIDVPPQNMVSISIPLGGYLKSSKLLPGMKVNKGVIIATIEDPQYIQIQQDYLTAKANAAFAEGEYNRQRQLNESKATSDKVFQQAEANYKSQRILIKSLYEKLKLIGINPDRLDENSLSRSINVFSPIDGYVSKVNVNVGKYANPSDVLFEIVNPADIHLALNVFEKDVDKLFVGQKVIAYGNANPEKKYVCTIILIGHDLSADRSAQVHCHFGQYDRALIPGMFMNGEIEISNQNVDVLPSDAVVSFDKKEHVFIEKSKNNFTMIPVITGNSQKGFIEIRSDSKINVETNIVVKGAYSLLMKIKNISE